MLWIIAIALVLFVLLWFVRQAYLIPDLYVLRRLLKNTSIGHMVISSRGRVRHISFSNSNGNAKNRPTQSIAVPKLAHKTSKAELVRLRSPMVGTFCWLKPQKSRRKYRRFGKKVKSGQTVAIIRALTLDNEVVSPVDGRIVSVKVRNGEPVEYGQVLAIIATKKDSLV